ncbi:MAG: bifunctional phosphoribosyl-AMP cyclohydrolase/phosphoribosyl-ATP diphosphatase HisIE [Bacteroidota bacterium]
MSTPNFAKYSDGLVPAIIQDVDTQKVLMLGYMNREAYQHTRESGRVTFFSRSRQDLWTKGETSGNFLNLEHISLDCDQDCLLVKVRPEGPVCHTGADTCFNEINRGDLAFLSKLARVIQERKMADPDESYTSLMFNKGLNKLAQKVGEEAVEVIIEAKDDRPDLFLNECADLIFHLMMLLEAKGHSLPQVVKVLESRHQ